ncbi:restriction endonuclease [Hymenobacter sp. PAMC 26628]|uniref:restriction endonuclease n=1 Tax=Hymenobacter sp. PAMC 26628 TaxID=1484118 RepID=UPI0009E843DC|nr:restriction endonuclease [Hymenobacter sp. PAMC 26628]
MNKAQSQKTGKPYEELIYKIYKELEPYAETRLNDKIMGVESGIEREIDISIKYKVAVTHEVLIIIQAKDHLKKADIKIIGEFNSVIKDVRASKGILICSSGFTKTAKNYAKNHKIELCSAHDASKMNWKAEIEIPVIKRKITVNSSLTGEFLAIEGMAGNDMIIPFQVKGDDGKDVDVHELLARKILNGDLTIARGSHSYAIQQQISATTYLYGKIPTEIPFNNPTINYTSDDRCYFKYFKPEEYRGLKNYITDEFTLSYIGVNKGDPILSIVDNESWAYVGEPNTLAITNNCVFIQHLFLINTIGNYGYNGFKVYWIRDGQLFDILNK